MTDTTTSTGRTVNTVLGPIPSHSLGVVAVHEALLSVIPGAQYAPDVTMDRAEIFDVLARKLSEFREQGGSTIVDSTGMFHGRDLKLYEALSRTTGVHIVASTGMGPEEMLGGYFLTPQTNPPTPWPADKFAALFSQEVTDGMVVPRLERRGAAGLVTTTAATEGMTATEESLFRGAARTALETGVPVSIRFGADALQDLDIILDENLPAERVLVAGLDRRDATGAALQVARRGAYVGLDHVGVENDPRYLNDAERADLILELVAAGFTERILLSSNAIGVAKGQPDTTVSFGHVLTSFIPLLKARGLGERESALLLIDNPRELLSVR